MDAATAVSRPHPLLLLAAASVTALSLTGVAVLGGWLPAGSAATPATPEIARTTAPAPPATVPAPLAKSETQKLGAGEAAPAPRRTTTAAKAAPPAATPAVVHASPGATEPSAISKAPEVLPIACAECGIVESIEEIAVEGKAGKTGAVVGGVVGGILGNQIGSGATRDVATLLGIAGGALAGHQIEKANTQALRYDIVVRMEDGTRRRIGSDTAPSWRSGDRVRIQNGELLSRG